MIDCFASKNSFWIDPQGHIRPCARYKEKTNHISTFDSFSSITNSESYIAIRNELERDIWPNGCVRCKEDEEKGLHSKRQFYKEVGLESPNDFMIDISMGNYCNLKCRMCNRVASSSILKEEKTYKTFSLDEIREQEYWLTNKILGTNNEKDFMEWLPHIVQIEFTGGEPLVSPENKQLIKAISETEHAKNIRIQLTTNATHYNATLVEQLKKFKEIHVDASVDDIGPRIEYARHGTKWVNLDRNLKKYNSVEEIVFHVWATVNNYNIWYLDELINYCDENNIVIALGALHTPSEFSIQHLPDHLKDAIREKYKVFPSMTKRLEPIINFLDASGDNHIEEFLATTKQYDETRSESFKDVFPEWRDMIYYG